jgi:hypothetical protein
VKRSVAFAFAVLAALPASAAWDNDARADLPMRVEPARPDVEVTADTAAQFYDVRSPTGETILARRRVTTTLGVGAFDLIERPTDLPRGTLAPELSFRARLRYDADYGANPSEADATRFSTFTPGFSRGPVDLMYGYVEGRHYLRGWLGFKIGRQYVTDALGWWSFDGGSVKVTSPYYVAAEAYAGFEVRGGMPLSSPRFERDGIWRGDRTGYDPALYPSYQPSSVAPAIGVAVESTGVTWLHGRLSYRRVYNTGSSNVSEYSSGLTGAATYDGWRTSQERLGYAIDANWSDHGGAKAAIVYDLYVARVTSMYASMDAYIGKSLTLSLDYDFYQPSFDGDSIWNFFAGEPMNDFGVRAAYDVTEKLSFSGNAHVRMFNVQTESFHYGDCLYSSPNVQPHPTSNPNCPNPASYDPNYYPTNGVAFDEGGGLAARYKWGEGLAGVRANANVGDGGDRIGGDVYGERVFETRYVATARASLWQWNDRLRPDRDATSFGYVAGVGYRFAPRSRAMFEWEHNMNRLSGQRFRFMLWLTVAVTK